MFQRFKKEQTMSPDLFASVFGTPPEIDLPGTFPLFCARPKEPKWIDASGCPARPGSPDQMIDVSPKPRAGED